MTDMSLEDDMNCQCNDPNFHFVSNASISGSQLIISFSDSPINIEDTNKFLFRFSTGVDLPTGYGDLPVYAVVNGSNIPVWNKYGDVMYGREFKLNMTGKACSRYTYKGYIGSQDGDLHLILINLPTPIINA